MVFSVIVMPGSFDLVLEKAQTIKNNAVYKKRDIGGKWVLKISKQQETRIELLY